MKLRQTLAQSFAVAYPDEVAAVLESRTSADAATVLFRLKPDVAATVIARMAPIPAADAFAEIEVEQASAIFTHLPFETAMSLLRRLSPTAREAIVEALHRDQASAVRTVIDFPAGTAGALMDPRVLAVTSDLTVDDAVKALRKDTASSHDDLYVVDRGQVLVGVLSLHELLPASPKETLGSIMMEPRYRLAADAGRDAIVNHPGWRHVHSLPVVDSENRYLGAIRYRTFRRLEDASRGEESAVAGMTAQALGDLFATGLGGFLGAVTSASATESRPSTTRDRQDTPGEPAKGDDDDQNIQ